MPLFTSAGATIVSAIFGAGGKLLGSYFTSKDMDEAKAESKAIYEQERADNLRRKKEANRLNQLNINYQKMQDRLARKERKETREYGMRENQFQKQIGLMNSNEGLKSNYLNFITRKAA